MTGPSSSSDSPPRRTGSAREGAGASPSAWKEEIAARVRARRGNRSSGNQPTLPGMEEAAHSPGSVAARVAERYSRLPSWREMLAAQAAAKSTVDSLVAAASAPASKPPAPQQLTILPEADPLEPAEPVPPPYSNDPIRYSVSVDSLPERRFTPPQAHPSLAVPAPRAGYPDDLLENAVVEPAQALPTTLITTPRELVAPRKARPRLAEGPLRDETGAAAHDPELASNPFAPAAHSPADAPPESTGTQARAAGSAASSHSSPEWHAIQLDTEAPIRERRLSSSPQNQPRLDVASIEDRVMAALVDCGLTLCAFLLFSAVFAVSSTSLPHGRIAVIGAAATLFAMGILYQLLFFTVTDATPGMRYAKIALCTFDDENPPRSAFRARIAALLLSALPLGLGFLWAVFDEDSLGWHDRITRTYQRSYRDA